MRRFTRLIDGGVSRIYKIVDAITVFESITPTGALFEASRVPPRAQESRRSQSRVPAAALCGIRLVAKNCSTRRHASRSTCVRWK